MKQAKWLLLLAVGIFVMLPGCKQLGNVRNVPVKAAATDYNIYAGNGDEIVGTCNISNDASNFYVLISLTGDYYIKEYQIWVGDDILEIVPNPGDPQEQWKRPPPGLFPYKETFTAPYPTTYTVTIPYTAGWSAYYFVIHLALGNDVTGESPTAYVGGTKVGHWWWYLQYTPTTEEPEYHSETAYGGDEYVAPPGWFYWFDWVVGTEGTATYDLWAGQWYDCGKVTAQEVDGYLRVTYVVEPSLDYDWVGMTEAHLYYGECPMPYEDRPTPGLAPYTWAGELTGSYYFDLPLAGYETGDCLYVIPHAVVWYQE